MQTVVETAPADAAVANRCSLRRGACSANRASVCSLVLLQAPCACWIARFGAGTMRAAAPPARSCRCKALGLAELHGTRPPLYPRPMQLLPSSLQVLGAEFRLERGWPPGSSRALEQFLWPRPASSSTSLITVEGTGSAEAGCRPRPWQPLLWAAPCGSTCAPHGGLRSTCAPSGQQQPARAAPAW